MSRKLDNSGRVAPPSGVRALRQGSVLRITLDAPQRANALRRADLGELRAIVDGAGSAPDIRVVVMTATGSSFCGGFHLGELGDLGHDALASDVIAATCAALASLRCPVIGALNGPVVGAGVQLALSCDLLVAVPSASFTLPAARLGLVYDPASTVQIAARLGQALARRLFLASESITSDALWRAGIIGAVVDRGELAAAAAALAERIIRASPGAVAAMKRVLAEGALDGAELVRDHARSAEFAEAITALRDRRRPQFADV